MSNPTTPFSWQMPTATDLVTDLPADFEVFGQAVATSMADLLGGTTGQVLSKTTNADMDFTWVTSDDANAIQNTIVDAKGDLIGATAADTPARLAVGTNGQVLTADSTAATGLAWATPLTGGLVFVKSVTIGTTVSSVAVTNAFSATYDNYLVMIDHNSGSNSGSVTLRLGATATGYVGNVIYMAATSSTVTGLGYTNEAQIFSHTINATNGGSAQIFFNRPNAAKRTSVMSKGMGFNTSGTCFNITQMFADNDTQYTDFTITAVTGTFTGGTIRVYGLTNS